MRHTQANPVGARRLSRGLSIRIEHDAVERSCIMLRIVCDDGTRIHIERSPKAHSFEAWVCAPKHRVISAAPVHTPLFSNPIHYIYAVAKVKDNREVRIALILRWQ